MPLRNLQFQKNPVYSPRTFKVHELPFKVIKMDIIWHGNSCFTVKGKTATAVINPYKDGKGLKLPGLKGDIVVATGNQDDNDNIEAVKGEPRVVDWPGEYEISGVVLTATQCPNKKGIFFTMVCEDTRICYIENIGKLDEDLVDKIGDVDVLIVPVGGTKDGMDAETAHKIAEELEPRCVIPMNFNVEGSSADLKPVGDFLKLAGASNAEPQEKFSLSSRSALRDDATECVVLEPQLG